MAKVIGVITARMASNRLPRKIMKTLSGKSMFAHHVERMRHVRGLEGVFLATSRDPQNEELIEEATRLNCGWYAGAEQDVVERHVALCERESADAVIRVPCDSPLFDIESPSTFVEEFQKEYRDYIYVSNMTMLQGTVKELVSYDALCRIHEYYRGPAITSPIQENRSAFNTLGIEIDLDLARPEYRLTVDHPEDFELMSQIYGALYEGKPISLRRVYVWLDDHPDIAFINRNAKVSGINQYIARLSDKPIYSLVRSGDKLAIFDAEKNVVMPGEFLRRFMEMFPDLNAGE